MKTKMQNILDKGILTYANLTYGGGEVSVESDGLFMALEIDYKGKFRSEFLAPQGFMLRANRKKIIILRLGDQDFPKTFLSYSGDLQITRFKAYGGQNREVQTSVSVNLDYWEYRDNRWNTGMKTNWEDLNSNYSYGTENGMPPPQISTFSHRLHSSSGKLTDPDGNPYEGDYNIDRNGVIRSGKFRTRESVVLKTPTPKGIVGKRKKIIKQARRFRGDY